MASSRNVKQQAQAIVDGLPIEADWDDVMYEVYVRQAVDAGERDIESGKTLSESDVRARLAERLKHRG